MGVAQRRVRLLKEGFVDALCALCRSIHSVKMWANGRNSDQSSAAASGSLS